MALWLLSALIWKLKQRRAVSATADHSVHRHADGSVHSHRHFH
jgi:hypothetical protein